MKHLLFLLAVIPSIALAQPASSPTPPTPPSANEQFLKQAVSILRSQREAAQDEAATAQVYRTQLQDQVADLQKHLAEATKATKEANQKAVTAEAKAAQLGSQVADLQKQLAEARAKH